MSGIPSRPYSDTFHCCLNNVRITSQIPTIKSGPRYVQQRTLVQSRSDEFVRDNGYMTPSFIVTGIIAQYNIVTGIIAQYNKVLEIKKNKYGP